MKVFMQRMLLVVFFLGLSSCGHMLHRSENSGYAGVSYFQPAPIRNGKRAKIEAETRDELNLYGNDLNDNQQDKLEKRMDLKDAEYAIPTKKERGLYYRFYSYFNTDKERLYFLNLPDYETKDRFLRERSYYEKEKTTPSQTAAAIEAQDIILGMTPAHVMESWGDPDVKEFAGNAMRGNERWKYSKFIPQSDGFEKEVRVIYFEHGRVVGWEKLH